MGQKTHPIGFRLGIVKTWNSRWFEEGRYKQWLHEDLELRNFLKQKLHSASISEITIERAANKVKINIFSARPGIIIGKRGAEVEKIRREVQKMTDSKVFLNIQEVRKAEVNAQLVAENIGQQLERRIAFRRALKRAVQTAMKFGAKGIRVNAAGRLGGAEMGPTRVVPARPRAAAHPARRHRLRLRTRRTRPYGHHRHQDLDPQAASCCPRFEGPARRSPIPAAKPARTRS